MDGAGHGAKLETPSMIPYTWLVWLPWKGGREYKEFVARMNHMAGYISVGRDRDTGRVYPDAVDGRCRVAYSPSAFDRANVLEGLVAMARINYVSGAREIFCMTPTMESFIRSDADDQKESDAKFEQWTARLRAHGFPAPESLFVSAHQMGTCRMSASPRTGVVDGSGEVWGTKGLHVMDASVFPTASGVNPMVTVMAIADSLSRALVDQWTTTVKL
jgi:choline dehydrogenase-like flavoprotein